MPNPVSMESCFLETFVRDGVSICTATGFVIEAGGLLYLVTNRHVLSGRARSSNEYLDERRLIPCAVVVTSSSEDSEGRLSFRRTEFELIGADLEVKWREHRFRGVDIDVAVLPIGRNREFPVRVLDPMRPALPEFPSFAFRPAVPDRVMIVGYPIGMDGGAPGIGVWVQGIIASEFDLPTGGERRFLVDSRTREGMSGSPVYLAPGGRLADPESEGLFTVVAQDATQMIGIYSGRVAIESDLGLVWHKSLIQEIVLEGVPGSVLQ